MPLIRHFYLDPGQYDPVEHAIRNLQALLDGRRGHGSYLTAAGIADAWVEQPGPEHIALLEARVRGDISRYEPRIEVLTFEPLAMSSTGRVRIKLTCRMRSGGERIQIELGKKHVRILRVG